MWTFEQGGGEIEGQEVHKLDLGRDYFEFAVDSRGYRNKRRCFRALSDLDKVMFVTQSVRWIVKPKM